MLGGSAVKQKSEREVYAPFMMEGFVSLGCGDSKVPVSILRDTAASQSFILKDVLPFPDLTAESNVLVQGFGMEYVGVPLYTVMLESDLVTGPVRVGICPCFPIEGVHLLAWK